MPFHVVLRIDEFLSDITQLLAQRSVVADAWPQAAAKKEVLHYPLLSGLGVACLVVHQQTAFFNVLCDDGLVEGTIVMIIACDDNHC